MRKESAQRKISAVLIRSTKSITAPNIEYAQHTVVISPDGGWGWVIVAMAFICYFLIDGVMYTFGLFLDDIGNTFGVGATEVALATSLMSGFYFIVGPFTCAITNRYGFRVVGIIGGIVSSMSFLLSTFFLNLNAFLILMGVLCGIGFNMIYIPCLLTVGFYFEKWRALATAISLCGSSLGVIAFPPMVSSLMGHLHWTWKFRILSGLTLLTSVCAFTFRPLKPVLVVIEGNSDNGPIQSGYSLNVDRRGSPKSLYETYHNTAHPTAFEYIDTVSMYTMPRRLTTDPTTNSDQSIGKSIFIYKTDNTSGNLSTVYETMDEELSMRKPTFKERWKRFCHCCYRDKSHDHDPSIATADVNRPLYRDDIFYAGSIFLLPEYSKATAQAGPSEKKSAISYHLSVTRIATQRDIQQTGQCLLCPEAVLRTIVSMLHLKLFKSPTFVFLTLSGFFSMVGMYCPFIFLVQRAGEMGIEPYRATLLLTAVGVANTLGRISCGVLSWFPRVNLLAVNYVTLIIGGVSTIVSNYLDNLAGQIVFATVFGFNLSSLHVLRSIVVVDLLGLENLTNAFGITAMFFGLGSLIGIPVAAALHKYTGTYDESFIFAGCALILSGILFIPLRRLSIWENRDK